MRAGHVGLFGEGASAFPDQRWSLPVLLRAAARGRPNLGTDKEDEINTDNEQELLRIGECQRSADHDKELQMSPRGLLGEGRSEPLTRPAPRHPSLPWDLVSFAEGLCQSISPDVVSPGTPTSPWWKEPASQKVFLEPQVPRAPIEAPFLRPRPAPIKDDDDLISEPSPSAREAHSPLARAVHLPEGASQISFSIASSYSVSASEEEPLRDGEVPCCLPMPPTQLDPSFPDDAGTDGDAEEVSPGCHGLAAVQISSELSLSEFDSADTTENSQSSPVSSWSAPSADRRRLADDSPSGCCCWLRRADCRFTRATGSWYCGISASEDATPLECTVSREVNSRERVALQQLFAAIDDSVDEVRNSQDQRCRARASDSIPALFTQLSMHLRGYLYQLQEKQCVETVEGDAVVLELFIRAVQLLDVLAPREEADGLGGEATPCFPYLVCDHLNQALGKEGLIPLCIHWLFPVSLEELDEEGPAALACELSFHALMTLQLLLLWSPPSRVSPPEETLLQKSGYQVVFDLAGKILSDVERDRPWKEVRLERLSLALDVLRLGLRSTAGMHSVCSCRANEDKPSSIILLPLRALDILALAPSQAPEDVVALSLASAARLLASLLQIPDIAQTEDFDYVAQCLRRALRFRPLSLPLTAAIRELLVCPRRPRTSRFGMGKEAYAKTRKELLRKVQQHGVLAELAAATTDRVEELLQEIHEQRRVSGGRRDVSCRQRGIKDVAVASLSPALEISAFFDNVEAAVRVVYKKISDLEEMRPLIQLRQSVEKPHVSAGRSPVPEIPAENWGCLPWKSKR